MVGYTVFVKIFEGFKLRVFLIPEHEFDACVDYRLAAHHILKIFKRYVYISEHIEVGAPLYTRAGILFIIRLFYHIADRLAAFELQMVAIAVRVNLCLHILRGILRGAKTESVCAERVLVASAVVGVILSAGIQLAEQELPVILILPAVELDGYTASVVLNLYGLILEAGDGNRIAEALARLVNGV